MHYKSYALLRLVQLRTGIQNFREHSWAHGVE